MEKAILEELIKIEADLFRNYEAIKRIREKIAGNCDNVQVISTSLKKPDNKKTLRELYRRQIKERFHKKYPFYSM